jgi:hypothetical protein
MPVHALFADEIASGPNAGEKFIEVQVRSPGAQTGTDLFDQPTYDDVVRLYLSEVPGGPSWNQARIDVAVGMMQARLPEGLWVVETSFDNGKAHLNYHITRIDPNG